MNKTTLTTPRADKGFPVKVEHTIGFVEFDSHGDHPLVAALTIIGSYEADHPQGGRYSFPAQDGSTVRVELSYQPPE